MLKPIESQHKPYYLASGEEVPSVTTILKVVNKPFLVGWANRQGLKGIDTSQQGQNITRIGTLVHALIESDLRGEPIDMSGYNQEELDIADKSFNRFLDWKIDHEVRPISLKRHWCATTLLRRGPSGKRLDIREVQIHLGHSSLSSTQRYTHIKGREVAEHVKERMGEFFRMKNEMVDSIKRSSNPHGTEHEYDGTVEI